jgi:hypothetical protein
MIIPSSAITAWHFRHTAAKTRRLSKRYLCNWGASIQDEFSCSTFEVEHLFLVPFFNVGRLDFVIKKLITEYTVARFHEGQLYTEPIPTASI